jgi:L-ribulose-5-phosphate 4-epimerase
MSAYSSLKQEAYDANMQLPAQGLVIFTFGNASVADQEHSVFAIKPSGVPYHELEPEKMVVMDFEGKTIEGTLRPSSDARTHALLYKHWKNIGAVVHTHSFYATAWAQALRDIPVYGTTHADHFTGPIPCTMPMSDELIRGDYEFATGMQIIQFFRENNLNYEELEMILIGCHAPFTWGKSASKAVYNSSILEALARLALLTEQLNADVKPIKNSLIKKHFERKHGPDSYYGQ